MVTLEQLAADKAAVEAAQAQLDKDQAAFDAAQPWLSVIAEIEAMVRGLPFTIPDEFASLIAKARSLI